MASQVIRIYPDSVINDIEVNPAGINLNFLMDGGRFPNPKHSVKDALQEMGVKYLRYPGGEKSDLYLFSLPPYEKSLPSLARTANLDDYPEVITSGKGFTWDPLDFDEFMEICGSLSAKPVIVVAADNYLAKAGKGEIVPTREDLIRNAVEWVRYANIKKKYGVRYWMIGNESWNKNNENSTAEIYAQDVIDFAKAMKSVDSSILIIPNGDSEEFFSRVMTLAGDYIDRICVSNYGVWDFNNGYNSYRDSTKCLIWPALTAIKSVDRFASGDQKRRLKVIVSEYGTIDWSGRWKGDNDIGHAIVAFDMTGQLLMQPQIEFSCFWNTRWIENETRPGIDHDALDKDGNINPTGFSLLIWNKYHGKKLVKTMSGSNPVIYSSFTPEENKLFVYLINKTENNVTVKIDIQHFKSAELNMAREYYGLGSGDMHPVWQAREMKSFDKLVELRGISITVLEMKLKR